jgi:hypothetical protein
MEVKLPQRGYTSDSGATLTLPNPPGGKKYEKTDIEVGVDDKFVPGAIDGNGNVTIKSKVTPGEHKIFVPVEYKDGKVDFGEGIVIFRTYRPNLPGDKLKKVKEQFEKTILDDLGHERFKVREDAKAKLEQLTGPLSDSDRNKVLEKGLTNPSPEIRQRCEAALGK